MIANATLALAACRPHPRNYNQHSWAQIENLRLSLRQFGQVRSVVVQADGAGGYLIVAGHGIVAAARAEGLRQLRADIIPADWSEIKVDAYLAADNELGRLSTPDDAQLAQLLSEISAAEAGLAVVAAGTEARLDALLAEARAAENPDPPPPEDDSDLVEQAAHLQETWRTAPGQLWQCGAHRVLCGDSTDPAAVARLMGGQRATLTPTDPPYNVGKVYDGAGTVDDEQSAAGYAAFTRAWFGLAQQVSDRQIVAPGCVNLTLWLRLFDAYHVAPWTKVNAVTNGKVSRWWCWEPLVFLGAGWPKRRANDVFDFSIGSQRQVGDHPCPKPLRMWRDLIENYSAAGDRLYEPFGGSGTTLIAAQQTGRIAHVMELSPAYTALILQRWTRLTGKLPTLSAA